MLNVPENNAVPSSSSCFGCRLGLVSIALYFANSMTYELRASDNRVSGLAADQTIEGAARYVSAVLTALRDERRGAQATRSSPARPCPSATRNSGSSAATRMPA